jgi:hypothetical protein
MRSTEDDVRGTSGREHSADRDEGNFLGQALCSGPYAH